MIRDSRYLRELEPGYRTLLRYESSNVRRTPSFPYFHRTSTSVVDKDMHTIWRLISSLLYTLVINAATVPLQLPETPSTNPFTYFDPHNPPHNLTRPFGLATRQLPGHDCTITLRYYPTLPIPPRTLRNVLSAAYLRITHSAQQLGDDVPIPGTFRQRIGNVVLTGGQIEQSPEELMTWGIMEEGVEVLQAFMQDGRGCVVEGEVREGMVGKGGVPVGLLGVELVERG